MHMCSMYIVHIWVLHAPAAGALVYAGAGALVVVLVLVALLVQVVALTDSSSPHSALPP